MLINRETQAARIAERLEALDLVALSDHRGGAVVMTTDQAAKLRSRNDYSNALKQLGRSSLGCRIRDFIPKQKGSLKSE